MKISRILRLIRLNRMRSESVILSQIYNRNRSLMNMFRSRKKIRRYCRQSRISIIARISNILQFYGCLNVNISPQVLRQTTLPIVPMRHQSFQRQLSHRLDLPNIKFSICSFENRSDSSLGLIKVFR